MITFSCPGCQATFRLPDEIAGKSARCSKCNHRFTVPSGAAVPAASAPATSGPVASAPASASAAAKAAAAPRPAAPRPAAAAAASAQPAPAPAAPPKKVALNPVPEVLEAEIVDEEPPPARSSEPVYDDVEVADDLDDRPRSRRSARRIDDVEEYDDADDDDDRPRRRRQKKGGGSLAWILATLGGVSFVLMIIFGIMMMVSSRGGGGGGGINQGQIAAGMFQDNNNLGLFDARDPRFPFQRKRDYQLQMDQNKTYVIDLESAAFDCFLRVEQPNGAVLFQDDDGGNGLNSRIVFRPPQTGPYVIVATSLGRGAGPYRLTVREQDGGIK